MAREAVVRIECRGESVELLPGRALWLAGRETLLIADPHFGKPATLRRGGIPIPEGNAEADLARLGRLLDETHARRLVILGDFLHARMGRTSMVLDQFAAWRSARIRLEMLLVRGNHDLSAGDPPAGWNITCVAEGECDPPWVYCHAPRLSPPGFVLAGHEHPVVVLDGRGGDRMRAPCFIFTEKHAILPAFSSLAAGSPIRRREGLRIYALGPDAVIELPAGTFRPVRGIAR